MEERRSFLGPTVVVGASLHSFSSTLWACSRHRRTTGPVFGWLPWQPPPPRLLHVNKENIGVRADCLIVLSLILFFFFFFFLFLSFLFFFSLFFVYLFFFSFCYNFNPLILPGNDDGFFFFSRGIFLFSCIVVEVWSRSCWDSSRTGKRIVFSLMNETKEKKREKYAEWCDFFTWCVSSCVAMNTRVDLTWSTLRLKFKSEDFEFSYL